MLIGILREVGYRVIHGLDLIARSRRIQGHTGIPNALGTIAAHFPHSHAKVCPGVGCVEVRRHTNLRQHITVAKVCVRPSLRR